MFSNSQMAFLCIFFAVLGVAAFGVLASAQKPLRVEIDELSGEQVGRLVELRGTARIASNHSSLLSLLVCGGGCVSSFVSRELAERLSEKGVDWQSFKQGRYVAVKGVLREGESGFFLQLLGENSVELIR